MTSAYEPQEEDDVAQRRAHNERQIVSQVIRSGVFHDILSYLAYTYPPGRSKKGLFPLGWIYATHVCASLRYSALETSSLWARHVCAFGTEHVFRVLLDRAGSFPITIDNVRDYALDEFSRRVYTIPGHYFRVLTRAASISLIAGLEQIGQVARELCGHDAPYLTSLKVHRSHSTFPHFVQATPLGVPPEQVGQVSYDIAPRAAFSKLRDAEFINTYMPVLGRNLVSLKIAGKLRESEPTARHILFMLQGCVSLESLRLQGFTRATPLESLTVSDEQTTSVHLPQLNELVLEARSGLFLASRLIHPPLEVASVIQYGGELEETTTKHVKAALSSLLCGGDHMQRTTRDKLNVYILRFYEPSMMPEFGCLLTLRASPSCIGDQRIFSYNTPKEPLGLSSPYAGPGTSEAQLTISVSGLDPVYQTQPGATMFLEEVFAAHRALSPALLGDIEVVHISIHPTREINWRKLLAPFTSAHTIIMAYEQPRLDDNDGLVDVLAEAFGDSVLVLPRLETIVTDKKVPWRPRDYLRFREMLKARAACDSPVRTVRSMAEREPPNALMKKYYDDLVKLTD
ncbi:unnamed protein product [Peniophora sp. CBMAI 1063]|nr:unnamed protein product [Peniophora sp. CBMAI 1063]